MTEEIIEVSIKQEDYVDAATNRKESGISSQKNTTQFQPFYFLALAISLNPVIFSIFISNGYSHSN